MSAEQHQNSEQSSFEERMQRGAENAVKCMGVSETDRVFIMTDKAREGIARRVAEAAKARRANVEMVLLEDFGKRPLTVFTDEFRQAIIQANPTVTFYIATAQPGEITFRIPLLPFLQQLGTRHGHMIGIDDRLMIEGMCADYDEVFETTNKVYEIVRNAKHIHVTSPKGTDVSATFHPEWKWIPCHGRYTTPGSWGNLPEGETYTAPATVDGVLVCEVLGDFFSEKYGVLKQPLTIKVKDGYITDISSENTALAQEVRDYLFSTPNGNRAGEFAIGTLTSLKQLSGNLLQDEKMPGLHVAFGNPYPELTGADWDAKVHVDVIPTQCTIEVDGRVIMRDGVFTL